MPIRLSRRFIISLILVLATGFPGSSLPPAAALAQQAPPPPAGRLAHDGLLAAPRLPSAGAAAVPRATPLDPGVAAEAPAPTAAPLAPEFAAWTRLVFQSARNGQDWEIYGARGDGAEQANLSNNGSMDVQPRLNRGATRVVFASNRDGNYEIYAMNADGSGQWRLTANDASDTYPAWSPDGGRIVFQSYRDGQAELYVMNADGSGQTRLTYHDEYDGEAAWSPDGTQIAFTRRSGDDYRIWVMNADGSGARQLSNQRNSENPAWSPDGSQIAYDADGNGDGWQEIWLMDTGGGNQRQVYDPPDGNTDAWVRSWSPDGRYIAFTRISWIYYQGNWYWTYAYLYALELPNAPTVMQMGGYDSDWHPDWQNADIWAPASRVEPLPAESPGIFYVEWTGTDTGIAGIQSYDAQVKDGAGGAWTDWQMGVEYDHAQFTGTGGHTYFFRVRASDYAGNVEPWPAGYDASTTVEALPPVTAIGELPPYTRGEVIQVEWSGSDPGGSGVATYDVQVQDGDGGVWTDWLLNEQWTSGPFTGVPGHTYRFRVRGVDFAQNVEPWPPDEKAGQTTLYSWAISGVVRDSSGSPVHGAAITTSPAPISAVSSDTAGAFAAHVGAKAATYVAAAAKAIYGPLPATAFSGAEDVQVEWVLPPADDVVRHGTFETGVLQPDWQASGALPTVITTTLHHTGDRAARLGASSLAFTPPVNLTNSPGDDGALQMAPDGAGGVHLFWQEATSGEVVALYARRGHDGTWLAPPGPVPTSGPGGWSMFDVGPDGAVHFVGWSENGGTTHVAYAARPVGGSWSVPISLGTAVQLADVRIAVSAANLVHVAWYDRDDFRIYWTMRDASGFWSEPRDISGPPQAGPSGWRLALDQGGGVHVVWSDGGMVTRYTCRTAAGDWLSAKDIRDGYVGDFDLAVDHGGRVHVAWTGILYAQGSCGGVWSAPVQVTSGGYPTLAVDRGGTVHLLAFFMGERIEYARRSSGGSWSAPQVLDGVPCYSPPPQLAVDDSGAAHVLWSGGITGWSPGTIQLYYTRRADDPAWTAPVNVSVAAQSLGLRNSSNALAVEGNGRVHAGWLDETEGMSDLYYATSLPIAQAGDAILSQEVTVPPASANPGLSLLYRLGGAFGATGNSFGVTVGSGTDTTTLIATDADTHDWTHRWFDLRNWAGQAVRVTFILHQAAGAGPAWAALDDISIGSTHPNIWVSQSGPAAATPGQQFVQTIDYGNRGGVAAGNGRVTLTLPAGLTFVSADPPPSATTPALRWDVGSLAAQGSPASILVTLRVAPAAAAGTILSAVAAITSSTAELEQANNTAEASIRVDYPDLWVNQSGPGKAAPGQRFVQAITYGNQGGAPAIAGRLTLQLPPELALIAADPPPSATSPALRWDVGDLAAQGETHTILATLQVAPSSALGRPVTTVAAIASDTAELAQANNRAEATLDIRALVYLPVIRR